MRQNNLFGDKKKTFQTYVKWIDVLSCKKGKTYCSIFFKYKVRQLQYLKNLF